MNRLDKQNLKSILKPFKDKIDNLSSGDNTDLDEFKSEVATQLNNKLSLTGGALMGPLSIINDTTNIVLSAQENSTISSTGTIKLYVKSGGKLHGKALPSNTGWQTIDLLKYIYKGEMKNEYYK